MAWIQAYGASVPNGKIVTPTDNIQLWLNCANVFDKAYIVSLAEVFADTSLLSTLMSSNNAVDYLVRSTTWASEICSNQNVMSYIGANNYCANTLLANSTWCSAICNSTYFENVLNTKVPTMTSNTTPNGVCSANAETNGRAYYPFNGTGTSTWWSPSTTSWIQYSFANPVKVYKYYIGCTDKLNVKLSALSLSVDGSVVKNISLPSSSNTSGSLNNVQSAQAYRFNLTVASGADVGCVKIQFYGRTDV